MKKLLAVTLVAFLTACAGTNFSWDNARKIKEGMPESEVMAIMGKPMSTTSTDKGIIYVWSYANGITMQTRSVSVIIKDGVVVSAPSIPDNF